MICEGCKGTHEAADCIDTKAGRTYPLRHCVCQHKRRIPDVRFSDKDELPAKGSAPEAGEGDSHG